MNIKLLYIVVIAALGGFLFGFDSGVISGCEKAIEAEFGLSAFWHGLIISGALIGTLIGGFAIGGVSVVVPLYIVEVSPGFDESVNPDLSAV